MMIDAILFVFLAIMPILVAMFASDEAGKYLSPELLFWIKNGIAVTGAAIGALKAFRSLSFANHLNQKAIEEGKDPMFGTKQPAIVVVDASTTAAGPLK